jgi:hypothetical protein
VARGLRLLLASALIVPSILLSARPAGACTCDAPAMKPARLLEEADAALVGAVVANEAVPDGTVQQVLVEEVYVGSVPERIQVHARIGAGVVDPCAVLFPAGEPVAMVLRTDAAGRYTQDACALLTVAALRRVGGEPRSPLPLQPPASATVVPVPTPTAAPVADPEPDVLAWWEVAGLGAVGAVALIGVTSILARRRARAGREEVPAPPGTGAGQPLA